MVAPVKKAATSAVKELHCERRKKEGGWVSSHAFNAAVKNARQPTLKSSTKRRKNDNVSGLSSSSLRSMARKTPHD